MIDRLYDSMPLNYWHTDPLSPGMKNQMKLVLSGAPVIGGIIQSVDNWNYINDYLNNRGIDWADVKYPGRIGGMHYGGALNFVSKNIDKLYK